MPQWATPERLQFLVDLFHQCGGFCVYGHSQCEHDDHYYLYKIEEFIRGWVEDDRWMRADLRKIEDSQLLPTHDLRGYGRTFDPIRQEQFYSTRDTYHIEGFGISGNTFNPFAKVRVPSTNQRLFVDVPTINTRCLSKNQRRKLKRYHKTSVDENCAAAVRDYWETL